MRHLARAMVVASIVVSFCGCRTASALTLVAEGTPRAVLILPVDAAPDEEKAAEEIVLHVGKISGAILPTLLADEPLHLKGHALIYVGRAADAELEDLVRQQGDNPASFALVVDGNSASLRGLSPEGTLFAAYELLEQLGVRWFMPGEFGTVIPQAKTVILAEQQTVQVPSFHARWHGGGGKDGWQRRVRMGGPRFPSSHGVDLAAGGSFEEHPEYYALINDKRVKRQLCVSNPEMVKLAVEATGDYFRNRPDAPWIGMGANDGRGFCECENCRALDAGDWDSFANEVSMTDRYIWLFNQILKGIEDEFPDKKICFYAYATYIQPPVNVKPDPRIVPAFAPITLCRVHGLGNPICPEKNFYYRKIIKAWGEILPEVYERGYWFNLADPGLPFIMVHRMRTQIPAGHELGITGWRVETLNHWGSEAPSPYIAAKLMWDHTADVDALLQDFYGKFFGPAAEPMGQYITVMDAALRDADHHTGCSWDMPHLYPAEVRKKARALLGEARGLAGDGIYGQRVRGLRLTFEYLEAFIEMLQRRAVHDWVGAKAALDRTQALREEMIAFDPPMANPEYTLSYMRRFFSQCTEQGYKRSTGGNRIVAALEDEWKFQIDPQGVGEALEFYRKDLSGGNWQKVKTSSSSWSNQGLRYYKGDAWYRQTAIIPKQFEGKRVLLWFGGVDEKAKVWVNGKLLGASPGGSFVPFEMDATQAIAPGRQNIVTVRLSNDVLNEIGTGGIVAPVMFYCPAGDEGAEP